MGTAWTIIVGIHICSILFLTTYLGRLFKYSGKYKMDESKYTLLFKWIHLSHVVLAYLVTMSLFTFTTILLLMFIS